MINFLGLPWEVDKMMDIEDQYTHVCTCTRIHTHSSYCQCGPSWSHSAVFRSPMSFKEAHRLSDEIAWVIWGRAQLPRAKVAPQKQAGGGVICPATGIGCVAGCNPEVGLGFRHGGHVAVWLWGEGLPPCSLQAYLQHSSQHQGQPLPLQRLQVSPVPE